MKQDRSLDTFECCPFGELPIGDAKLEFIRGDAQSQGYAEELPSAWAGAKTAASSLSSVADTPHNLRATS